MNTKCALSQKALRFVFCILKFKNNFHYVFGIYRVNNYNL